MSTRILNPMPARVCSFFCNSVFPFLILELVRGNQVLLSDHHRDNHRRRGRYDTCEGLSQAMTVRPRSHVIMFHHVSSIERWQLHKGHASLKKPARSRASILVRM